MTVAELLRRSALLIGGESARLDAELLLGHCLARPRSWLYGHGDEELEPADRARYETLVARRRDGEPIAYLTGRREFWSLDLAVSPATLVPRPETELLVEVTLERLGAARGLRVADLGTGSGAIALAIASERPDWQVLGVDRSAESLEVAEANRRALGFDNVEFRFGNWCRELPHRFDALVSNPPYIASADPCLNTAELRYEPRPALVSGADGLDDIRCIVAQAPAWLEGRGWLLVEHGFAQAQAIRELFTRAGFVDIDSRRDLAGHDRITLGRWRAT